METLAALLDLPGLLLIAVIFLPIERLLPLHREQKTLRRGWANDLFYFVFNRLPIALGTLAVLALVSALGDAVMPASVRAAVSAQPLWVQAIEVLLLADLGFYLMHRTFHAVPLLWRFHAIHHSIEELDWLAAHRVHPVDQVLVKAASLVPALLLGFSEWALLTYFVIYQWHALLLHANVRLSWGPLDRVIASPVFHHWHHANHPEAWNRNFAGQLALWDVLFGTAHLTHGRAPERYGIDDPVPPTYGAQMLYPFRRAAAPSAKPQALPG